MRSWAVWASRTVTRGGGLGLGSMFVAFGHEIAAALRRSGLGAVCGGGEECRCEQCLGVCGCANACVGGRTLGDPSRSLCPAGSGGMSLQSWERGDGDVVGLRVMDIR